MREYTSNGGVGTELCDGLIRTSVDGYEEIWNQLEETSRTLPPVASATSIGE
jgi:hypothetical protein